MTETAEPALPSAASAPPTLESQTSAPEETHVEIHKVKPIHTWRDFLKELGTIVLGIIIAISLEHLVESWRWASEVKDARQALRAEILANNANFLAWRLAVAPCVDRQINRASDRLVALEGKPAPENFVLREPSGSLLRDSEWQAERASQVLTHFPRAELALMSRYYAHLDDFRRWQTREGEAWTELQAIQLPTAGLSTSDVLRLRASLITARGMENLIVANARRELNVTKQLGIPDPAPDPVRVKNFCTMSADAYRRYRSSQDLR